MRKTPAFICFILAGVLLIAALFVTCIEMSALDPGFYEREYDRLGQAGVIGISREDLRAVTQNLLDYAKGLRTDLDMRFMIRGEMREVFNQKEKTHMEDVRTLYLRARDARNAALLGAVLLAAAGLLLYGRGRARAALRAYTRTALAFLAVAAVAALYAALDFQSFWTSFHLLFFTNDLWLLDPAKDVLIMMVPGQFFFDLVTQILLIFFAAFAALIIAAACALRILKKREARPA